MNKGNKFVTGCCITIGVGIAFCLTGFAMGAKVTGVGFGPHGISVYTPEGKVGEQQAVPKAGEEMLPEFDSIKIEVDYADVFLQPAEEYGISYRVDGGNLLSYEIEDGTLVIKESADKEGFHAEFIHIGYGVASGTEKGRIMVGLPEGCDLAEITVDNDYGDIALEDVTTEEINLNAGSGKVSLLGAVADQVAVENDYGDIALEDVTAGKINLNADSGKVSLSEAAADEVAVYNDYGDIALEDVTAGQIDLNADSGKISLSEVAADQVAVYNDYGDVEGKGLQTGSFSGEISSGNCDLEELEVKNVKLDSEYGNVALKLQKPLTDYNFGLRTEYGKVLLDGRDMGENYQSLEQNGNQVEVYCESGDIEIRGAE